MAGFPRANGLKLLSNWASQIFIYMSCVEQKTGEHFSLEIPYVNTNCMNAFLEEMSKFYAGDEIILVMDGAGWHKAKNLQVPDNIEIIVLPPYSPELNPVERFWQHIKQNTIKNQIYKTLNALKDAVAKFLNSMSSEEISSVCNSGYL